MKLFFNPILAGIVGITEGNILDHCCLLHENVKTLILRTTGASNGALAKRMGKAKAEMTIPVVMKVQNSLREEVAFMSSEKRRPINVGSGDST